MLQKIRRFLIDLLLTCFVLALMAGALTACHSEADDQQVAADSVTSLGAEVREEQDEHKRIELALKRMQQEQQQLLGLK